MTLSRRHILTAAAAVPLVGRRALAAGFPTRPISIVVPFPPGGNVDVATRIVAARMQEVLGQTIIVLNKGGAGGIVGAEFVHRARPDGYTLLAGSNGPLSLGPVFRTPSYDVAKDFALVGLLSWTPDVIVVRAQFPAKSVAELLDYAKTHQVRAGSGGIESAPGMAMAEFRLMTGLKVLEVVYAGSAPFYPALMGGEIDMVFDQISTASPMARSGAVRMLAVTDETRSALAPDLPTVAQLGYGKEVAGAYIGLVAPAGVPDDALGVIRAAYVKTMETPEVKQKLQAIGSVVQDTTPQALGAVIQRDTERARRVAAEMKKG